MTLCLYKWTKWHSCSQSQSHPLCSSQPASYITQHASHLCRASISKFISARPVYTFIVAVYVTAITYAWTDGYTHKILLSMYRCLWADCLHVHFKLINDREAYSHTTWHHYCHINVLCLGQHPWHHSCSQTHPHGLPRHHCQHRREDHTWRNCHVQCVVSSADNMYPIKNVLFACGKLLRKFLGSINYNNILSPSLLQ